MTPAGTVDCTKYWPGSGRVMMRANILRLSDAPSASGIRPPAVFRKYDAWSA